ncbi:WIAG-tail domain [Paenibacillus terrae]|uniref:WIAG-tail domain n=1 Tax=Paenibacillus terrae TaxID=159743 RepID=A0A0D7X5T1_9BACL|nr:WIAG-tail domain [Paenibacillus terrae]KJD46363.1 hypothetical protein QD47_07345 [Paenibacillus terrae]
MNHRMNHNSKDKRTARRNLSNAVPSPRIDKNKTSSVSGKPIQRETASVKSIVDTQAPTHDPITVDEAAWRKHKLPKTLEEAMLMNRASVLLLSVPEADTEHNTEEGISSIAYRGQSEQESLLDCSITSIHIAEGRHRPKQQRVALSADKPAAAFTDDDEPPLNVTYDDGLLREHTFNSRVASTRFGSIPFYIPAEADRDDVSIVFEQPFQDVRYAITGNASIPGVIVSVTNCQRDSTVFTVERRHAGSVCEGLILWIAIGHD